MAKHIVKRRKKRIRWSGVIAFVFVIAVFAHLFTQIFVRFEHTRVMREIQVVNRQIEQVSVENETLAAEINELSNIDRVLSITTAAGLSTTENTIVIEKGE